MGAFESIASVEATSYTGSLSLTSIPQTYKHLYVRLTAKTSYLGGTVNFPSYFRLNSDSTNGNYFNAVMDTSSSSGATYGQSASYVLFTSAGDDSSYSGIYATNEILILDYTSTTKYKQVFSSYGQITYLIGAGGVTSTSFCEYRNTTAISTITAQTAIGQFYPGTSMELYGFSGS